MTERIVELVSQRAQVMRKVVSPPDFWMEMRDAGDMLWM